MLTGGQSWVPGSLVTGPESSAYALACQAGSWVLWWTYPGMDISKGDCGLKGS